jgi:hypothetical protein
VRALAGPLRIVVAIAAPETGGGAVLDYERELRNVLAAVRAARQDAADVRVVPFATPEAIGAELDRGLSACRRTLGGESFASALLEAAGDSELAETITALVDRVDAAGDGPG